jgi:hypothetical protein
VRGRRPESPAPLKAPRSILRPLAWGLAASAAFAAVLAWLGLTAAADLARGRERLLAGDASAAAAAFSRARRWPGTSATARAGGGGGGGRRGPGGRRSRPPRHAAPLAPEALLLSALEGGEARRGRRGSPLSRAGPGSRSRPSTRPRSRSSAGTRPRRARTPRSSPFPLDARGLGRRLRDALEARGGGATPSCSIATESWRHGRPRRRARGGGRRRRSWPASSRGRAAPRRRSRVRLSLDLGLSRVAREALGERRGSIVLVEPRTGAVLAAVSDERTVAAEGAAAFAQRREPASIAKVLTAAAAYRAGHRRGREIGARPAPASSATAGSPCGAPSPPAPSRGSTTPSP